LSDDFRIEPLGDKHDRAAFSCGKAPLDQYIRTQAAPAVEKNLAAVFILTPDGVKIAGYYTLSAYVIKLDEIPEAIAKKLTRMREVPATLIGRFATHIDLRGKGLGKVLLADALKKALENSVHVASLAVVVDAKDNEAAEFYKKYGFIPVPCGANRLFLPMDTVRKLF
jgi:GNAT superfamily N-acetyltransferase